MRGNFLLGLSVIIFTLFPAIGITPAYAGGVPSYNIETYCYYVANSVGGSYVIEAECRKQEKEAMRKIAIDSIPDRIWQYCDKVAQSIGGSYVIFDACVGQELEAASSLR